jgi:chromosome partitioning protein
MIKIAVVSQKGGAGKSTLALHLASEGATRGRKALLLDLDPQGNLVGWAQRRGDELPPDVDAIHASKLLVQIVEAEAEGYDLLVLDTAPSADRASVLAAEAADLILIPCRPAQFDLDAIKATLATARATKRQHMVVLNAAPVRSRVVDEALALMKQEGADVSRVIVHHRVAFQHCLTDGATAAEFEPGGAAAKEIAGLYDDMLKCLSDGTSTRRAA